MSKKKKEFNPITAEKLSNELQLQAFGADSHAHLNHEAFSEDLELVLLRAKNAKLNTIINVFTDPADWELFRPIFEDFNTKNDQSNLGTTENQKLTIYSTLGIHPNDVDIWSEQNKNKIKQAFATDPKLKAIGEIGLDFFWNKDNIEKQKEVFTSQLELAKQLDLPVIIHCRDAFIPTFELLLQKGFKDYPLLWHCFCFAQTELELILNQGWDVSIPGPVTYKANKDLREAIKLIPTDKLHLETDCPYLSPQEYRGKRNEPSYTVFTAKVIAETLNINTEILWKCCGNNTRRFFKTD